jgi:prophage regulatory protein
MIHSFMRKPAVLATTGKSRTGLYEDEKRGTFVKAVLIGGRAVAYPAHEVDAIVKARIAGRSEDEIRALVEQLHSARSELL